MIRASVVVLLIAALAVPVLAGCAPQPSEEGSLKIGLLPILDVIPLHVAEREGYFAAQGLAVELVQFASALERDAAIQAGQIDGQINDLVSSALLNRDADRIRVVRVAMRATAERRQFAILAAASSRLQSPADLKGVEIAISSNTVIEYMTDKMLLAAGLGRGDIKKTEVTKIPVRLELLSKGQVQAATLPEPLASLAISQGARLLTDDTRLTQFSQSEVAMRVDVLKRKPNTVKRFLAAYEQAVKAITANPSAYSDILIEKGAVPEPVRGTFTMPPFPAASVPAKAEVEDVVQWAVERGLLSSPLAYEKLVDGSYLPR